MIFDLIFPVMTEPDSLNYQWRDFFFGGAATQGRR